MQNEETFQCHEFHVMKKHSAFCLLPSSFSAAFSLIELIVVMLIVGILAMVTIIKFTGVDSSSNRVAANELRSHLTYIRNMAMSRERAMKVQFSVVSNRYNVYMATNKWTDGYLPAKDPVTQKDWIVDLNSKFSGVTLASIDINGGNTLFFSETNGMPFDAAWAPLTANGVITFKNSTLRVRVIPVTGYAEVIEKIIALEPLETEPLEPEPLP